MKKNPIWFSIILRGLSCSSSDQVIEASGNRVLTKIQRFLEEYKDIITKDILDGLPPMIIISHCKDLIRRGSFPNKAPYRLTPSENEELNR